MTITQWIDGLQNFFTSFDGDKSDKRLIYSRVHIKPRFGISLKKEAQGKEPSWYQNWEHYACRIDNITNIGTSDHDYKIYRVLGT